MHSRMFINVHDLIGIGTGVGTIVVPRIYSFIKTKLENRAKFEARQKGARQAIVALLCLLCVVSVAGLARGGR